MLAFRLRRARLARLLRLLLFPLLFGRWLWLVGLRGLRLAHPAERLHHAVVREGLGQRIRDLGYLELPPVERVLRAQGLVVVVDCRLDGGQCIVPLLPLRHVGDGHLLLSHRLPLDLLEPLFLVVLPASLTPCSCLFLHRCQTKGSVVAVATVVAAVVATVVAAVVGGVGGGGGGGGRRRFPLPSLLVGVFFGLDAPAVWVELHELLKPIDHAVVVCLVRKVDDSFQRLGFEIGAHALDREPCAPDLGVLLRRRLGRRLVRVDRLGVQRERQERDGVEKVAEFLFLFTPFLEPGLRLPPPPAPVRIGHAAPPAGPSEPASQRALPTHLLAPSHRVMSVPRAPRAFL